MVGRGGGDGGSFPSCEPPDDWWSSLHACIGLGIRGRGAGEERAYHGRGDFPHACAFWRVSPFFDVVVVVMSFLGSWFLGQGGSSSSSSQTQIKGEWVSNSMLQRPLHGLVGFECCL